jgi:hypothetical protein
MNYNNDDYSDNISEQNIFPQNENDDLDSKTYTDYDTIDVDTKNKLFKTQEKNNYITKGGKKRRTRRYKKRYTKRSKSHTRRRSHRKYYRK